MPLQFANLTPTIGGFGLRGKIQSGSETQEPDNPKHGTRNPPTTHRGGPTHPILQFVHYTV